jgi:RNA polymerase sigma-70 factor (ECF subfamily)
MELTAFHQMLNEHLDSVYRMAFHLADNQDDAIDVAHETFMRALRAAPDFELRERGMRPWLFKILHNCFYTRMNRKHRGPHLSEDLGWVRGSSNPAISSEAGSEAAAQPATVDWEYVDQRLKQAVQALPTAQREVLLLWAVEGFKYREIADTLDIPIGTVMSRLARARRVLSPQLSGLANEHGVGGDAVAAAQTQAVAA